VGVYAFALRACASKMFEAAANWTQASNIQMIFHSDNQDFVGVLTKKYSEALQISRADITALSWIADLSTGKNSL